MKRKRALDRFTAIRLIAGIAALLTFCLVKFYIDGEFRTWMEVLERLTKGAGITPEYILFFIPFGFVLLYLIRELLLLAGKWWRWFSWLPALGSITFAGVLAFITYSADILLYAKIPLYYLAMFTVEFISIKYLEQREDLNERYGEIKAREKKDKEHRKKANHFPGKYPPEFYEVIRQNFRYHWKEQIVFLISGILLAAICYIVFAIYFMTDRIYGGKGKTSFMFGQGIHGIFQSLALILGVLSVLMMVLMISWYIKEQKKEYRLMVILGIRKNTAYRIFLVEFSINVLAAAVIGLPIGMIGAAVLRRGFARSFQGHIELPSVVSVSQVLIGFAAYVMLMILALGFNQENFISLGNSTELNEERKKERKPERRLALWIVSGIGLYVLAIKWITIRGWTEMKFIYCLPALGIFFLLSGGMALWLKKRKNGAGYYKHLFRWNPFYYRFWKNVMVLFYLSVVQFLLLALFSTPFITSNMRQDIPAMYPYDIVCTAYETDLSELEQIAADADATVYQYPMVRMTSLYGSDTVPNWNGSTRPVQWPQGQHIAISESTYNQMRKNAGQKPRKLGLKGKEMHAVYQQDLSVKANVLDWDTTRFSVHLRFGQPLEYYDTAGYWNVFPEREIVSEERNSLIGAFQQGKQENLIVLSDAYFEEVWNQISTQNRENWAKRETISKAEWKFYSAVHEGNLTEGPTMLYCMNVPDGKSAEVAENLEYLKEKHSLDRVWDRSIQPFYERTQMIRNTESEILLARTANGFILLVLVIMAAFQYFLYVKQEEDTWKWEDTFLEKIGMRRKERAKKIGFQLRFFMLLPMIQAVIGGIFFIGITLKARLFTVSEVLRYGRFMGIMYAIYILFWLFIYSMMQRYVLKRLQKENS